MGQRTNAQAIVNVRLLATAVAAGLIAVAGPANSQSCGGGANAGPARPDRSWIHSSAVIFGANSKQGVFRFHLGSDRIEPIGHHEGWTVADFRMSADRKKLIYDLVDVSDGHAGHWLYDIKTGREIELEALTKEIGPWDRVKYSPDNSSVAWVPRPGEGSRVRVMNLQTRRVQTFRLPTFTPDKDAVMFGLAWSRDGKEVLVGARSMPLLESYWSANPSTGQLRQIRGRRQKDNVDPVDSIHYIRDGMDIGDDCILCDRQAQFSHDLIGGARVSTRANGSVVIERPGSAAEVIAKFEQAEPVKIATGEYVVSACGGVYVGLAGQFDGRYVMFTREGDYWIYGVLEKRAVQLNDEPGTDFLW